MNNPLNTWLESIRDFAGLFAVYVTEPQQPLTLKSWSHKYAAEGITALHRQVQDVVDVLAAGEMPARKLRWIFDRTVVYYERRKDGTGMGLITSHEPWVGEGDPITRLIDEFRSADSSG